MWKQRDAAHATYSPETTSLADGTPATWSLAVEGAGDEGGWRMGVAAMASPETAGAAVELRTGEGNPLPPLSDSYLRGNDFVTSFAPRPQDPFGLSVQVRPLACDPAEAVVELTIAVHTERLDSHPLVCLNMMTQPEGDTEQPVGLGPGTVGPRRLAGSTSPLYASLLLAPRDQPAAHNQSDAEQLQVALFGGFLEKGVIRKSRPWLVFRSGRPSTANELAGWYERLCRSPLPLTT